MVQANESKKINSYLVFQLGEESFAASVTKILNILEMVKVTKVPKAPDYMKGVINLRGKVVPLIDTRKKFEMGEISVTTNTCILVLDIQMNKKNVQVGALVDAVLEVLEFDDQEIQPPPSLGTKYKSEFIEGMVKNNDDLIMILNMDKVFTTDELITINDQIVEENMAEKKQNQIP